MMKKTFKLFANCIIVKGISRATICDLHRGEIILIPIEMANFLYKIEKSDYISVINLYDKEDIETIVEYVEYFISKDLGFWTDEPEYYPPLSKEWKSPEIINNAIIEIENLSQKNIIDIVNSLSSLYCKFVEIRYYNSFNIQLLEKFLKEAKNSSITGVFIYAPIRDAGSIELLNNLITSYDEIVSLFIIHSNEGKKNDIKKNIKIKTIVKKIDNKNLCGIISKDMFSIKIPVFMESLSHNSCLNKKVSIDLEGNIKNCPSMVHSFGNINNDDIEDIVNSENFKKNWFIHKDLISICKDCEFRHVCTDCRAYLEEPDNLFSKPLKCGYNPYTNEWEEWSKNPLKQKEIKFYDLK